MYVFYHFLLNFLFQVGVLDEQLQLVVVGHAAGYFFQHRELVAEMRQLAGIFFLLIAFYLFKLGSTKICSTRRLSEAALPLED